MSPLAVNEVIDRLEDLQGQDVTIQGILNFEFENCCIEHYPKAERRPGSDNSHHLSGSSIWLSVGFGSLAFNSPTLEKWHGKRVVVEGTLYGPDPKLGGCGHLSGWPAELLARTMERNNR